MRVILTSVPIYSHLVPLVIPLAKEFTKLGHEVAVATGEAVADELVKNGITPLILPRAVDPGQVQQDPELAARLGITVFSAPQETAFHDPDLTIKFIREFFFGIPARFFGEDLVEVATEWRPDLIIRECTELGGYLAAERLGIPHAVLDVSPITTEQLTSWSDFLNEARAEFDLEGSVDADHSSGILRAAVVPEIWYGEVIDPAVRHYLPPAEENTTPLDPAIANLDTSGPLVLATLGSNAPNIPDLCAGIFSTIIDALGDLPCTGVVALGKDYDPADWQGMVPSNVHLASFVQQRKLLVACDMFITHAGFSGIRESLLAGVPMVAIPLFAEQPDNARRITELGLGLSISPEQLTTQALRTAGRQVLQDPAFRVSAKGMQRRMLGLPSFDQLVEDLAKLVK